MSCVVAVVVLVMYFSSIAQVGHDWTSGGLGEVEASDGATASSDAVASSVLPSSEKEPSSEGVSVTFGSSAATAVEESSAPRSSPPAPVPVSGATNAPDAAPGIVFSGSPASAAQAVRGTSRTSAAIGDLTPSRSGARGT